MFLRVHRPGRGRRYVLLSEIGSGEVKVVGAEDALSGCSTRWKRKMLVQVRNMQVCGCGGLALALALNWSFAPLVRFLLSRLGRLFVGELSSGAWNGTIVGSREGGSAWCLIVAWGWS